MDYYGISPSSDFFAHYGVKGMKWGVRKYAADKYARPSKKFYDRYVNNKINVSPRTMSRDANNFGTSQNKIERLKHKIAIQLNNELVGPGKNFNTKRISDLVDAGRTKATQQANISQMQGAIRAAAKKAGYIETKKMKTAYKDPITGYLTVPYVIKYKKKRRR